MVYKHIENKNHQDPLQVNREKALSDKSCFFLWQDYQTGRDEVDQGFRNSVGRVINLMGLPYGLDARTTELGGLGTGWILLLGVWNSVISERGSELRPQASVLGKVLLNIFIIGLNENFKEDMFTAFGDRLKDKYIMARVRISVQINLTDYTQWVESKNMKWKSQCASFGSLGLPVQV